MAAVTDHPSRPEPVVRRTARVSRWLTLLIGLVLWGSVLLRLAIERYDLVTGVLFILAAAVAAVVATDLTLAAVGARRGTRIRARVALAILASGVLAIELFLRFGLAGTTYLEHNLGQGYMSVRRHMPVRRFPSHPPSSLVRMPRPEFVHERQTNSLGLAEQEIPAQPRPDEYRILALGDSFTEGWGASYEQTWVKAMERALAGQLPHRRITTINAGVGGSDPCFQYVMLAERLLPLNPALVVVALNDSDVIDIRLRGGMERFLPDGSLRPITPPSWEWLYGISYITRQVVHGALGYDMLFTPPDQVSARTNEAIRTLRDVLTRFAQLGAEHGFELAVVLQPTQFEVLAGRYANPLQDLIPSSAGREHVQYVDLLKAFQHESEFTPTTASKYYWPIDNHPTPRGYEVLGRALADHLLRAGLIR
jgi:lysophospholipase L1-like esterase